MSKKTLIFDILAIIALSLFLYWYVKNGYPDLI